jgi:uncharacterized protein YpmB
MNDRKLKHHHLTMSYSGIYFIIVHISYLLQKAKLPQTSADSKARECCSQSTELLPIMGCERVC